MELFLEDELPKEIKLKIVSRIKELESNNFVPFTHNPSHRIQSSSGVIHSTETLQAPSTQRLLAQHPELTVKAPEPMTAAAAQALSRRQEALMTAGKEEKGRTSPRKF